jgi:cysteine desulfurase
MAHSIYLDHSATTPLRPEVLEAMMPFLTDHFGNAGSAHRFGRTSRKAVDDARDQVAALINSDPRDIIFTAGGTEADNMAIRGITIASQKDRPRIIVSSIEHHAILQTAESLAEQGIVELKVIPVDEGGQVRHEVLSALIDDNTALVSVMHANNETGVIQPIEAISAICRERGIPFHSDTVQSAGKLPIDVEAMHINALALAGHKLYGPKGVGALYLRKHQAMESIITGGAQEQARRAGTENVAAIVGLGKACELARIDRQESWRQLASLRERLEEGILATVPGAAVNGRVDARLPHVSNIRFNGVEGESIMLALDMEGIAVSTGSACTSGSIDPSPVLLAMGQPHEAALSAIRISLGRDTTEDNINHVLGIFPSLIERLRATEPLTPMQ